jgi:hypothetical protein
MDRLKQIIYSKCACKDLTLDLLHISDSKTVEEDLIDLIIDQNSTIESQKEELKKLKLDLDESEEKVLDLRQRN